jgi:hypothetical protein
MQFSGEGPLQRLVPTARRWIFLAALAAIFSGASRQPAVADNASVLVQMLHVNPVQSPEGPIETVQGCLNNPVCNNLLQIAASYAGVPPQAVRFAGYAAAPFRHAGEESRFSYSAPPGFTLCRVDIRTKSVVPASGDRSTHFSISANRGGISIYTWTPRGKWGAGRSWYDGYVTLLSVPTQLVGRMRLCGLNLGPVSWACRGTAGAKGLPGCGRMQLGDIVW